MNGYRKTYSQTVIKMIERNKEKLELNELEKAIEAVNERVSPDRIFLFGSFVHGHADKESDLDLCIIIDQLQERKIETLRSIRYSIAEDISVPIDLLLYTTQEFNERARLSSTFEHKIMNEGVLVYES
ncbi:Nucleotidyltransferase domain-containing protein [Natribacillus halophilus]|uniref:Nucleotidyltransferase domain-containing protein n=2 Tax=Natribacillus halophilus TaxID=549003 RepID=A0A1G8LVH7_9BACI|nr:Nucleotidyltransferase domain-containing protein [Natribacillus halophilus]